MEDLFAEPEDFFRKPREDTTHLIELDEKTKFTIRVVGEHALWGNYLWNASKCITEYFYKNQEIVKGKRLVNFEHSHLYRVLELGAAAGLPSIACAKFGALHTVITDYPDDVLINNIKFNVQQNSLNEENVSVMVYILSKNFNRKGYLWGKPTDALIEKAKGKFDVVIMSDLIFNHSAHQDLLNACKTTCHENAQIFVAFSHHRPWKAKDDLRFFELAKENHFKVEELFQKKYPGMERRVLLNMVVMFPEDPGSEEVRSTVHVYKMTFMKS